VQFKAAGGDAIGGAARRSAEIGGVFWIVIEVVEAENERRLVSCQPKILYHGAPGHDIGGQTASSELHAVDSLTACRLTKDLAFSHEAPPNQCRPNLIDLRGRCNGKAKVS